MTDSHSPIKDEEDESIEIVELQERAEKLSEQIKELTVKEDLSEGSSSHVDENDEGTVIENEARENLEEEEEKNSVGESLLKVESILMEIDKELGNNGDEN